MTRVEPLIGQDQFVADWVQRQLGFDRDFGKSTAIGWALDGELIAGTVFHNWSPEAAVIEMSSAAVSPRWLTKRVLNVMMGYVFGVVRCQMVLMRVSEKNERMCSIARRFGFAGVLIRRLRGPQEDEFIFTLTLEEWMAHSMRIDDGQAIRAAAA